MPYIVKSPVEGYNGISAGVSFKDGVGQTDNTAAVDWLKCHGYKVTGKQDKAQEAPQPEAPQPEAPQPEAPQPETPQPEAPQPEAPQPETPQPETPQPKTKASDGAKKADSKKGGKA